MSVEKSQILKIKLYYQEFHHKCISWYVTIMGFFIAGAIAAGSPDSLNDNMFGYSIIGVSLTLSFLFFLCMFHYSKRIDVLNSYLDKEASDIPATWYKDSKNVGIAVKGVGSWFFLSIVLSMQFAVYWLVLLKFLR
ncbi:MAG: hypothetical protein C0622_10860 [Desulfuromonas sp.]|nr:MAG: hypothetical protein C0622_10860 [Desulfuromonas sp.]